MSAVIEAGPVLMCFVLGAMIISAFSKGSDAFHILAHGSIAFIPLIDHLDFG